MVHADARHDGNGREEDVGGVEPAAHADLGDGELHALAGEPERAERGRRLEEGGFGEPARDEPRRRRLDLVEEREEGVVGNLGAVDAKALGESHQVRRGVEPGAEAGRAEDRGEHRRDGALAVGARHVQHAEGLLRVAELAQQGADLVEPRLDAERAARVEALEALVSPVRFHGRGF